MRLCFGVGRCGSAGRRPVAVSLLERRKLRLGRCEVVKHGDERGLRVGADERAEYQTEAERRDQADHHHGEAESAAENACAERTEQDAQVNRAARENVPAEEAEHENDQCAEVAAEYGRGIAGSAPRAVLLVVMQHDPAERIG